MARIYKPDTLAENRFKQTQLIKTRPTGWIVMDSWNNKIFPMTNGQSIDSMKFDTEKLQTIFHQEYGGSTRDLFLPWHYTMDLVNNKPFVVQTRPLMYKSGFPGFQNYITIMIVGDSNQDIYSGLFYKQMAHCIINPLKHAPGIRMPNSKENFIFWTGANFDQNNLLKEMQ